MVGLVWLLVNLRKLGVCGALAALETTNYTVCVCFYVYDVPINDPIPLHICKRTDVDRHLFKALSTYTGSS